MLFLGIWSSLQKSICWIVNLSLSMSLFIHDVSSIKLNFYLLIKINEKNVGQSVPINFRSNFISD